METHAVGDAALTVSLALAAGIVTQSVARHLRIPGIVLLLGAGVLLGPDVWGAVRPEALGPALQILVGFAVSVILFEGAMNLNLRRLLREARIIQNLLTIGALLTGAGGALSAWVLMGWDWRLSILFGALVIVTGPTVVTPLLRRIKVKRQVKTVLEGEGVLIDAIGAVLGVVVLQVVLSPLGSSLATGLTGIIARLGFGILGGLVGGFLLAFLLRFRKVVPEGLENVFTLSLVLALYQVSGTVIPESGVVSVTVAGLVVGNARTPALQDLLEFKEQLTMMFVGMLFVLLAADVRVAEVHSLGIPGLATVFCLMFVVRPVNIAASTLGSDLSAREKIFLSWLAPRGIVAAALASLFAQELSAAGVPGGKEFRALIFLVIASTVLLQGVSAGWVARLLGLRRPVDQGYVILGANELGHALGRVLRDAGEEVVFLDNNPADCEVVEKDDFRVIYGNALEERTLQRARVEDRAACLAVTPNEDANLLFSRKAVEEFKVPRIYLALRRSQSTIREEMVHKEGGSVLFGAPRDFELWAVRLRRGIAEVQGWRLEVEEKMNGGGNSEEFPDIPVNVLLPLAVLRKGKTFPVHSGVSFRREDVVHFAVFLEQHREARDWLRSRGWVRVGSPASR